MVLEAGSLFLAFGPGPAADEIIEAVKETSESDRVDGSSKSAAIEQAMITVASEIVATLQASRVGRPMERLGSGTH